MNGMATNHWHVLLERRILLHIQDCNLECGGITIGFCGIFHSFDISFYIVTQLIYGMAPIALFHYYQSKILSLAVCENAEVPI